MRSYSAYLERSLAKHGAKFTDSQIAQKFVPFYESGDRIKVLSPYGEIEFGTVGVTTGWIPSFLLIHNTRSLGSSILLTDEWKIIAVKTGRTYQEVSQ